MKNLIQLVHGCIKKVSQGLGKSVVTLALGAVVGYGALMPSTASAAAMSQLEYLHWLVNLTGDSGQFNANSTAADYVNWAKVKGITPNAGWNPSSGLTKDVLAQTLVQLLHLNPHKFGGDYVKILAREGIVLSDDNDVTRT